MISMIDLKNYMKIFLACIISTVILVINNMTIHIDSSFITIIETSILYFAIYGLLLLIMKENIVKEIISNFKTRVFK